MVLFILFNEIGMSVNQWKVHPFDESIKTTLLSGLKKFGDVFVYNPIFYNFQHFNVKILNGVYNDNYKFSIKDINLDDHCKKLFTEVYKLDTDFIVISHGYGYIIANAFVNAYSEHVKGIVNINGGNTKEWLKAWLSQEKVTFLKKIKDKELNDLYKNLDKKNNISDIINLLNNIVQYNIIKQSQPIQNKITNIPIFIFTNVITKNGLETLDKFKYCNELVQLHENVKCFYFLDKSDFLYFEISKQILEIAKELVNKIKLNTVVNY